MAMNIARELSKRFQDAEYSYLDAAEMLADAEAKQFGAIASRFYRLTETVDEIPADAIQLTRQLASEAGRKRFEEILEKHVVQVGRTSFPDSAADFVATLNLTLRFADS